MSGLFDKVSNEWVVCTNDPKLVTYRLVRFSVNQEGYSILTNRLDLTTLQVITLYAYRWQIELLFRFFKRTLQGIHLVKHDAQGVTIQFYIMMIVVLLQLHLKQTVLDWIDPVAVEHLPITDTEADQESVIDIDPPQVNVEQVTPETKPDKSQPAIAYPKAAAKEKPVHSSFRSGEATFLTILGRSVKKYWKISIHWLTALRDLLASSFDSKTIKILQDIP